VKTKQTDPINAPAERKSQRESRRFFISTSIMLVTALLSACVALPPAIETMNTYWR
jgi:hypothetical protein